MDTRRNAEHSMTAPWSILPARSPADISAAAALFREYAAGLGFDLCFQRFDEELATLPGKYAPPGGELLLVRRVHQSAPGDPEPRGASQQSTAVPIGCVALRPITPGVCEMKRLYVAPSARGSGLGRTLVEAILAAAAHMGYRQMRLDTLPSMADAIALYRKLGFHPIEPYYDTPVAGTLFLARDLP